MMKRFVKNSLAILAVLVLGMTIVALTTDGAVAQSTEAAKNAICEGIGVTGANGSGCAPVEGEPGVDSTIENVIDIMSLLVGIISVIMIIIGGLKYITSTGDSSKVNSAKDTILYAVIGLVVVAMAQVIVQFVLNEI